MKRPAVRRRRTAVIEADARPIRRVRQVVDLQQHPKSLQAAIFLEGVADLRVDLLVGQDLREAAVGEQLHHLALERRAVAVADASLEAVLFVIAGDIEHRSRQAGNSHLLAANCRSGSDCDLVFDQLPITPKPSSSDVNALELERSADLDALDVAARPVVRHGDRPIGLMITPSGMFVCSGRQRESAEVERQDPRVNVVVELLVEAGDRNVARRTDVPFVADVQPPLPATAPGSGCRRSPTTD